MQVVHYDLPKDTEAFLHRSGRTGRAGKSGTTIAVLMPRDRGVFRRICQETKIRDLEWISTPAPGDVMAASAKQVGYLIGHINTFCETAVRLKALMYIFSVLGKGNTN